MSEIASFEWGKASRRFGLASARKGDPGEPDGEMRPRTEVRVARVVCECRCETASALVLRVRGRRVAPCKGDAHAREND